MNNVTIQIQIAFVKRNFVQDAEANACIMDIISTQCVNHLSSISKVYREMFLYIEKYQTQHGELKRYTNKANKPI